MQRLFFPLLLLLAFCQLGFADEQTPDSSKTIRNIYIKLLDIFEGDKLDSFYRTANSIKVNTKEFVIKRELLFKEGDKYDQFVIDESIRNLRTLRYIRNVKITPKLEGEFVDLYVQAQDTWTLIPILDIGTSPGAKHFAAGLGERNLLGLGKQLQFLYDSKNSRNEEDLYYADRRLMGSNVDFLTSFAHRSDGYTSFTSIGQPFRTLLDKESWSFTSDLGNTVQKLFKDGSEYFIFKEKHDDFSTQYAIATNEGESLFHRLSLGYDYISERFHSATDKDIRDVDVDPASVSRDPALLASNRRFSSPFLIYRRIESDFVTMNYIDRFDREFDYNLGNDLSVKFGYAPKAFDSTRDTVLFNFNDADGYRFSPGAFVRGELGVSSRLNSDGLENSLVRTEVRAYDVYGPLWLEGLSLGRHTFAGSFSMSYGRDIDNDRQLVLGSANGLRGYKSDLFTGDKSILFNIEDRVHIADDVLKIVSVGAAAFVDVGGASFDTFHELVGHELYPDIGVGLRFAIPRSTGAQVVRMDLALPLRDAANGDRSLKLRLTFIGGQAFDSRLPSETRGVEIANTRFGFANDN